MKGVQFPVDESGETKSVLIDLDVWGDLWEDFYDLMSFEDREGGETVSWEVVKEEIRAERMREESAHEPVPS
ncbi:MAG: hypothetical protein O3A46_17400 [Candidatus Poribacteria bacterium]|nr:hypothetical protein [Candidatus Poribacteria bacterium]